MKMQSKLLLAMTWLIFLSDTLAGGQNHPEKPSLAFTRDAIDSLFATREFLQAQISPSGGRVAWVESIPGKGGARSPNSAILIADLSSTGARPKRVSAGNGNAPYAEHDVVWSPDSRRVAFLSDVGSKGQLQLYVADATSGTSKALTHLSGFLSDPRWSPDGKTIAVLYTENAPRAAGPLEAETPDVGVVQEHIYEQRLTLVDVATAQMRQLSTADMYVYEYDWSPDGKRFVAIAAHGSGDDNWFVAELYTIEAVSGATRSIYKPPLQIAVPRWAPDGESIAFIGGLMSDEGQVGNDIFVISARGGEARNLTTRMKASAAWIAWAPSGKRILFAEHIDGMSGLATVDLTDGLISTLWTGSETVSASEWGMTLSLSRDANRTAIICHSFNRPPEIWAGDLGHWKQITFRNKNVRPGWGKAESVHWTSEDFTVQGWLLYPRHFDPQRRYPLVVAVHGGPAFLAEPRWPSSFDYPTLFSSADYFVFYPNPRGSYGHGEAFTRANVKDFGYGDFRDILAGVDEVLKKVPIDERRLGLTGWSYGGYMTMWGVTQTNRFRAAVAGAGIANWQSYYGENRIDQWMIPYFGASVYDDPAVYAKSSPITFIKNVKTPTLILVGDRDGECPPPQSYEFWHALKTLGVETELVIYPNEGHLIAKPGHRRDIIERALAWFDSHIPPP